MAQAHLPEALPGSDVMVLEELPLLIRNHGVWLGGCELRQPSEGPPGSWMRHQRMAHAAELKEQQGHVQATTHVSPELCPG